MHEEAGYARRLSNNNGNPETREAQRIYLHAPGSRIRSDGAKKKHVTAIHQAVVSFVARPVSDFPPVLSGWAELERRTRGGNRCSENKTWPLELTIGPTGSNVIVFTKQNTLKNGGVFWVPQS